jgi:hypothetical protein
VKTEVVGITGLTTYGQSDTSEHGHPHRCCDFTPDAPGVNPQAAIMAIATRNCDHFLDGA